MSKSDYSVEDFVLDPEFRKWVVSQDSASKSYWESYIESNPNKLKEIKLAREIVLNLARNSFDVSQERIDATWNQIDLATEAYDMENQEGKVIPLYAHSTIKKFEYHNRPYSKSYQFYRLVGILAITTILAILVNVALLNFSEPLPVVTESIEYEEHIAPPGVKSNLTLQDGSKVILNSGSKLRYIKNFGKTERLLELEGEAFFEVAKDENRPFMVKTGQVTTKALGTSFNIKAYKFENLAISLLTGLVEVNLEKSQPESVKLIPGEELSVDLESDQFQKGVFDEKKLMAWTRKTILFDHTPIDEITRVLGNWYGVDITFENKPQPDLVVSGVFRDQTLKNVLEGLSYSARFDYEINNDQIKITFK